MMKCKIVHNEGILLLLMLISIIAVIDCSFLSSFSSIQELCSSNRYIYIIKPDEPQELRLSYNTTAKEIDKWYRKSKRKCRIEFKTINGAYHFALHISNMSIPSCSEKCQCNYFEIAEPGNTEKFCGYNKENIYFESRSNYLAIDFHHENSMAFGVVLLFSVKRNNYIITGQPNEPFHSGHFIETPYFPNSYSADYLSEYTFHTDDPDGRAMLLFLDFQISSSSYIEVIGHNHSIPDRIYGGVFRPPVFVSQQNELILKFDANSQPGNAGFRAVAYFIKSSDVVASKPFTDCGGFKFGYGGLLTLEAQESRLYDCLWHITTPMISEEIAYLLTVSNISLVDAGNSSLEFRAGRNSKFPIVTTYDCASMNCSSITSEVTVSAYSGLYIRFFGRLNRLSSVKMVYSTYHHGNCSHELPYCQGRCLSPSLFCDGIEHCPDGSDELECTTQTIEVTTVAPAPPVVEKKIAPSKSGISFHIILSVGICGLIVLISTVVLLIYKGVKTVPPSEHNEQEVVTEMAGPPLYPTSEHTTVDHLPSYDDFIKAADRYPPLLYTRAAKRYSEPPYPARINLMHTTSFCKIPAIDNLSSNSASSEEAIFVDDLPLTPEPSCSYERSNVTSNFNKQESLNCTPQIKRAWQSDTKLDQLRNSDCHLHLSITHCTSPYSKCHCPLKQYLSLPIKVKINNCKSNDINIILPNNAAPKVDLGRNRHLSFSQNSDSNSKIVTIKTRCHSDPCQFSVQYSVYP